MRPLVRIPTLALATALAAACTDASHTTAPTAGVALARQSAGAAERLVTMMDACDPTTFNAALNDPTACVRNGGVTFDHFIAQLQKHGSIGSWRNAPSKLNVHVGQTLVAWNRGGEVHTFTEVAEFGGGFIPILNQLSGNPVPAPECLALDADDFVPPGGAYRDDVEEAETERYQCCLHPWMRTTVHARER